MRFIRAIHRSRSGKTSLLVTGLLSLATLGPLLYGPRTTDALLIANQTEAKAPSLYRSTQSLLQLQAMIALRTAGQRAHQNGTQMPNELLNLCLAEAFEWIPVDSSLSQPWVHDLSSPVHWRCRILAPQTSIWTFLFSGTTDRQKEVARVVYRFDPP